jgi:hypothetical protein
VTGLPFASVFSIRVEMFPQVPMGSGGLDMSSLQPVWWLPAQRWVGRRIPKIGNDAKRCDVTHSHDHMKVAEVT